MISRVADHCFWFGRYIDRAESTARLLQVTRTLVFDADIPVTQCWKPLVIVSGAEPIFTKRFGAGAMGNGETVQTYMTWEPENLVSLHTTVRAARESARVIRDVLSLEAWEEVNELYHWMNGEDAKEVYRTNREQFYRRVRKATQLVLGLVRSTMLHDTPMSLLWSGVMLERVGQTARTLDMHHHIQGAASGGDQQPLLQTATWLSLLRACSGFEAFMRREQGRVSREAAVSFLVYEARFPRSLRYCVRSALALSRRLDATGGKGAVTEARVRLEALDRWLDSQEDKEIPLSIHALLTHVVEEASTACQELQQGVEGATAVAAAAQKAAAQ